MISFGIVDFYRVRRIKATLMKLISVEGFDSQQIDML